MTQQTYSFLDFKASISGPGGSFNIGSDAGVAEEGITFEMEEDKDTMTVGADGEAMHSLHAGKAGKITIRLLKTSPVNQQLSQLYHFQTTSSANHGQNVITGNDIARGDSHVGRQAAFAKFPTVGYSKDGPMNEWVFNVGKLTMQLGTGSPAR
jgi:hypothetical protein